MPRLKGNTKEIILEKSLKLFAKDGFAAVSIRTIAAEVGIGNSALYKHFPSKQAIFDALVEDQKRKYLEYAKQVSAEIRGVDAVTKACLNMYRYQTTNEEIVSFRQLLLIEQFRDPKMAEIYREFFVDIPLERLSSIFKTLQKQGLMKEGDACVYAMELYAPFYLFHLAAHKDMEEYFRIHVKRFSSNFIMKKDRI